MANMDNNEQIAVDEFGFAGLAFDGVVENDGIRHLFGKCFQPSATLSRRNCSTDSADIVPSW